jgi:hypothetical protein
VSSELVMRMRTCAAAIAAVDPKSGWVALVTDDAANLLIEASNLLDALNEEEPIGDLMQPLKSSPALGAVWTAAGELPAAVPRPCPGCGLVSARTTRIAGRRLLLTCPMCSHEWEYAP